MITIKEVKKEYFRVEGLLKFEGINQKTYMAHCKEGFSPYTIKRLLGLTYNEMKEQIGAKKASNLRPAHTYTKSKGKIICNRDGKKISINNCIPGCNDACIICENKQIQNVKAGGDTLTPEEHREQTLSGTYRSSAAIAVEDGYKDN